MKLEIAQKMVTAALAAARTRNLKPLAVAVLDARGSPRALAAEDGTSLRRSDIAIGKAHGALSLGMGSRSIMGRAEQQPYFIAAVTSSVGDALVPVPGGVLVRDADGCRLGAVVVTGDTSDNDEAAAVAGIESAGLTAQPD